MTSSISKQEPHSPEFAALHEQRKYWDAMISNARDMIPSHIRNGYQAILVVGYGRSLGLPDITSLQEITVIKGKIFMSAKLQMALVRQRCPHARISVSKCDSSGAWLVVKRGVDEPEIEVSFTLEEAKRAGLGGNNWEKYPADMVWARAVSRMCRRVFPDITLGAYALEEVSDMESVDTEEEVPLSEKRRGEPDLGNRALLSRLGGLDDEDPPIDVEMGGDDDGR